MFCLSVTLAYACLVSIIQKNDMPEAKLKTLNNVCWYLRRFTVEADGIEAVCIQREDILFPTGYEKHISFGGDLLHTETIGGWHPSAIEKADFRTVRTVYLDIAVSDIGKYRLCR